MQRFRVAVTLIVMGSLRNSRGRSLRGDPLLRIGSERDLEVLYRREHESMVRLAFLLLRSREQAEEVVHEAFIAVFERRGSVKDPVAYLRQVVVNGCRGLARRSSVERRKYEIVGSWPPGPPMPVPGDIDETWNRMASLAPDQRVALALRYYEDLSVAEIAKVMGMRPGTVKSHIHRGIKELRRDNAEQ